MRSRLTIAILAAGRAGRFGGGKLDAGFLGRPLGEHALDAAIALNMGPPLIVVGDTPPSFASEAERRGRAILAINPLADSGLASSVALAAAKAAEAGSNALLLLLADMPLVVPPTLERLIGAATAERPAAVLHEGVPNGPGRPGIPACFPASQFAALQALKGERGATALLRGAADPITIEAPHEELLDIDTADDLAALEARHRL